MKRKKEIRRTPALKERKAPRSATPPPPPVAVAVPTDTATVARSVPATPPPTPPTRTRPVARFRRAGASPAQRRGADLVRYLRIHSKHPYGERGIRAIEKLAREVAHLANLELAQRHGEN
jgi:hypothetical protein